MTESSEPNQAPDLPIDPGAFRWPTLELDPVERMRILAEGLPHTAIRETLFDTDFDRVWSFIADLENSTSQYEASVSRVHILERTPEGDGEKILLDSKLMSGLALRFQVVLRPGWCVMNSRWGAIGMAARPEAAGQTRFIHFERSHFASRILRRYFFWNIGRDFKKLHRLFE